MDEVEEKTDGLRWKWIIHLPASTLASNLDRVEDYDLGRWCSLPVVGDERMREKKRGIKKRERK